MYLNAYIRTLASGPLYEKCSKIFSASMTKWSLLGSQRPITKALSYLTWKWLFELIFLLRYGNDFCLAASNRENERIPPPESEKQTGSSNSENDSNSSGNIFFSYRKLSTTMTNEREGTVRPQFIILQFNGFCNSIHWSSDPLKGFKLNQTNRFHDLTYWLVLPVEFDKFGFYCTWNWVLQNDSSLKNCVIVFAENICGPILEYQWIERFFFLVI